MEILHCDVTVIGAGAAGLCAALSASDNGLSVIILERDRSPAGNTAKTLGMLPSAGTRFQAEKGIEDSADIFLDDILKKTKGKTDKALARAVVEASADCVEWLHDQHGVHFELLDDILYPGHSRHRYHVPKSRTGVELQENLLSAVRRAKVTLLTHAQASELIADPNGKITQVNFQHDGKHKAIKAKAVILACGGYGADSALVKQHIPDMKDAVYCGHHGSDGDALRWGTAIGADVADLGGYQGHCVATGVHLPVTWALIIRGGFQVNAQGQRFSNEMSGYSEQASEVLAQPGGAVWTIYDKRCEEPALSFQDYQNVIASGSIRSGATLADLAAQIGISSQALQQSYDQVNNAISGEAVDPFGRDFSAIEPLKAPFFAVEVRGALFHTQGGLRVNDEARVLRPDGSALPNLLAAGGAARGLSGPSPHGYLGGNGLLTAVVLGRLAGKSAKGLHENSQSI